MSTLAARPPHQFIAGHPVLDFSNTLHGRLEQEQLDQLVGYSALTEWARLAGLLDGTEAKHLARIERADAPGARRVVARAKRAREALYAVVSALAGGGPLPTVPLRILNRELRAVGGRLQLALDDRRRGLSWNVGEPLELGTPLRRVMWAAAQLLATQPRVPIRECEAPTCSWLFVDGTRNHSRRWCDTAQCGNRERVRRHYRRRSASRRS
ncbi:MAG: CGNR zinc finger domain-containing protein [Longimicrobiales bacterium]